MPYCARIALTLSLCLSSADAQNLRDKIEGMLIGSAIGDAAGGPVEFVDPPQRSYWSLADQPITDAGIADLAARFKLRSYEKEVEPFAQWQAFGPAGTITDDTRFKLIFFKALDDSRGRLELKDFAQAVLDFRKTLSPEYQGHYDTWIPEIEYATRWALGERKGNTLPVERIWGGIPTMEGQMPFLPIAALKPFDPEWCYLKTYELGYFDIGVAKDMNSALVAGLARALQPDGDWETLEAAMRDVDPYRYNEVLYVDRQLVRWLDRARSIAGRANGNVKRLFQLLEAELQTIYWWEAWVPIVVVFACAETVDYDPLASMQLIIEFGHDTDSYAQVMGAILGAIHGKDIFPKTLRDTVNQTMKDQFGQNVSDWMSLIDKYGESTRP